MEEHDDSSRCEIENTPLLAVRCEIKNTTPLDVELNKDERIGVSSLAEPDLNSKYKADDDNEIKPVDPKETEKQTAVVYPYDETKSNGCKEVGHKDAILRHITKEHFQGTGVYENKEEQGSEIKTKENQICLRSEDQSLSSMDPDKGTSELQIIDWTKVFLQLSRSFSPTHWKLFALELLSNCQEMARSVDKTVNEIELEARNQHTEGWVFHAYFKVFNKWLNNLGSTRATFEHIKDAATNAFDSVEDKNRIDSIKRNPPMKVATPMCPPLEPCKLDRTFGSNYGHSQQYMALHDNEAQGNSNCERGIYVSSIQTRSYQMAHCPYCSRYTTNEISNQENTLVRLNKNSIETKYNDIDEREQIGKRKKDQPTTQQNKRIANDKYIVENAKQNLLFDIMPIRQNDYDMFMDFVIDLISNECHVSQEAVLSITYKGFCKAHQTKTKENETLYIIKSGKTSLCIGKEVFEDLAVYGNIARPKLLKYLEEKNIDCDNSTLLFIKFEQMKNKDVKSVRSDAEKENNAEQNFQVNGQNGLCPDMNESEEPFSIKTSLKQNSSGQLFEPEEKVGTTQVEHGQKELDNKAKSEQETVTNNGKDDKDAGIEKELESIKESFFPDGDETYDLPTADNVADILNNFMDQD
ncbi:uncharacterized protein LOC132734129 [Ruditapes philippinarum]|uniref:uncharacterized protein LOC132734129 n=1 Tax=Ruditapes philippinarum TaxID=129788 RepID=UPI00295A8FA1|nr:uncharacterized protein LOC132734129 [Ruditapes philippinarum]